MFDFAEYWLSKKANREVIPLLTIEQLTEQLGLPEPIVYACSEPLTGTGANDPNLKPPVSPGQVIQAALDHIQLTQAELAEIMGMSRQNMHRIIHGERGISPDYAILLEDILHIPAHVLMRLQADYDLYRCRRIAPLEDPIVPHSTM